MYSPFFWVTMSFPPSCFSIISSLLYAKCINAVGSLKPKSKKGKDSINTGINTVKALKIYITDNSLNTLKELKRYKWKVDKNGHTTNVPIDKYNHSADAIRYGAEYLTKTNRLEIL